nr:integrase, catalytic region, zinc finger, CCHC-type, peptidase aspartic, catalytic [Tanacetum cinerariifolium]
MMKGSDIGIHEKKAKLFNEWKRFLVAFSFLRFAKETALRFGLCVLLIEDSLTSLHFVSRLSCVLPQDLLHFVVGLTDLALNVDNVFQDEDCDAFDSDVDEAPTAQTMFMAKLSSADPITDEAGPSYDSDNLSE